MRNFFTVLFRCPLVDNVPVVILQLRRAGNHYVLVMVDHFAKCCESVPIVQPKLLIPTETSLVSSIWIRAPHFKTPLRRMPHWPILGTSPFFSMVAGGKNNLLCSIVLYFMAGFRNLKNSHFNQVRNKGKWINMTKNLHWTCRQMNDGYWA